MQNNEKEKRGLIKPAIKMVHDSKRIHAIRTRHEFMLVYKYQYRIIDLNLAACNYEKARDRIFYNDSLDIFHLRRRKSPFFRAIISHMVRFIRNLRESEET